jgi:protein-L-isoaspartate(D-aspartate) O-methyltransferase
MATDFERARKRMVQDQVSARGITDAKVIAAMEKVPRHRFVDEALADRAYSDRALPVGEKQTISQPYVVARSVAAAQLTGAERVLEIGAGSGYQAAVLAECARRVYTIERIPALATRARRILEELGYGNVVVRLADGTEGWKDQAPFDAILVAAAAPSIPEPLLSQLKDGGRLVIPLDRPGSDGQVLTVAQRHGSEVLTTELDAVVFVPLIGRHGHDDG